MTTARTRIAELLPAPKWVPLSAGIGAISGLMAITFFGSVELSTRWLLGSVGYHPATVAGDAGGFHLATGFPWPWAIPLLAAAGALVAAVLGARAPETKGHGTDVAIRAINTAPAGMRILAAPVKLIASAITLGSGGSGGTEGPTAQVAATCASFLVRVPFLVRVFRLDDRDARTAVTAGLAAGVGAIFRAPLGGAMLGVELLFRKDREWAMLAPSLIASGVSYAEFGAVYGYGPMFGHVPGMRVTAVAQLLIFPVLGLCCGLLARLYTVSFYGIEELFDRWRTWPPIRCGVAGLATGTLGLFVLGVLGPGYGMIQYVLSPGLVLHLSLLVLIAMPFAKILATSLSIGSGASGGVFGPGMVVGATAGALLWRLAVLAGLTGVASPSPALLAAVGMAACLGAAARSPFAITLIAAETCGSFWVLPTALLAVPIAVALMGSDSLYRAQPLDRRQLAAEQERQAPEREGQAPEREPLAGRATERPMPPAAVVPNAELRGIASLRGARNRPGST
jgi:CIC family chloride channel protein